MSSDPKNRVPLRLDTLGAYIEQKLDREGAVLDLLLSGEIKGQASPEIWQSLHAAAQRDGRLKELGAAYDKLAKDKKIKTLTPASQAEILTQAGVFFADVSPEPARAADMFERALAALPGHAPAFERLEKLLVDRQDLAKLSDLYAASAFSRGDKKEQLDLLRRATDIATGAGDEERVIKLYQQILKMEPGDAEAQRSLDERYTKAGRFGDLAKLLEQSLGASPGPGEDDALAIRARLIRIYMGELKQIEPALGHVEEILRVDPSVEPAFEVAEQLLANKSVAARVASALAGVYDRMGDANEAARMLAIEVDHLRGPKRVEAQKRLATLIFQKIGDIHGAFGHYEAIVTVDPGDEEYRQRYRELAAVLDKRADATKVLARAVMSVKEPGLRARINAELGELFLEVGDAKKAKAALQAVLDAGGDEGAVLRATRAMVKIAEGARDTKALAAALERLSDLEDSPPEKAAAGARLAKLYEEELNDQKAAAGAYKKLIGTPLEAQGLSALEKIYRAASSEADLAFVLERRSLLETDPDRARELAFQSAEIKTRLGDRSGALDAWRVYIATHGPSREAHALMFPLLEQEKKWDELAQRLAREAELAPREERAAVLARIGQIRLASLKDERGAIEVFRDALAIDPAEKLSRTSVERSLAGGSHRLAAAAVLEPIARSERSAELLVRVLDARGALAATADERLRALAEAAAAAEKELGDARRALEIAGRALKSAVDGSSAAPEGGGEADPSDRVPASEVQAWLERVERLGAADAAKRADVLMKALGDRAITSDLLLALASRAGAALAESGASAKALEVYRRALAFNPASAELLARVDDLLQEQGSPAERVALFRAALERAADDQAKRKLLHKIAGLERRELNDLPAAIATYRQLAEDAGDKAALDALLEAHEAAGPSPGYYEDLEKALARAPGAEQGALRLRMAGVARALGRMDEAIDHYRTLLAEGTPIPTKSLEEIERIADETSDVPLLYATVARRASAATEPREEARWLERLGEIAATRRKDAGAAAGLWKRAASVVEHAAAFSEDDQGDAAWARRLFERVLEVAPGDIEAAERLADLYRQAGLWEKAPAVHELLIRAARTEVDAVRRLLGFEEAAIRASVTARYLDLARFIEEEHGPLSMAAGHAVQTSIARVLASDPERYDEAAAAYRRLLEGAEADPKPVVAAFEAFLAGKSRHEDRRYLFTYRLARAAEGERVPLLMAWASDEERAMGDAKAANDLYARVLAIDPDHEGALEARSRLLLEAGDVQGAVGLITTQRDARTGAARAALDRQLAALLIDKLNRPEEALSTITPVIEANPADEQALAITARALEHPDTRARAAEVLERACDSAVVQEIRNKILDMLLATPPDASELRAKRSGWFERLLAPLSDNPHRALEVTLRAVGERPQEAALWDRVEQLGRETGQPELVAEAYRREIQRQKSGALDIDAIEELGRRAVEYHEQWKDEPAEIAALLGRIVELIPESTWAFERLKMAYNAAEQWEELFNLYDRAIARSEDRSERAILLEEAVEAAKNLASDTERTMGYLEQLLPLKNDARTRSALERLYEKHGRFRPLIDLLAGQLGDLDREAAQRMRGRIAGLWLDGVGDPAQAFEVIAEMLRIEPGRAEGLALLEKLLGMTQAPAEGQGEARRARARAAALLEDRYRSEGRAQDLVRVLEVALEAQDDASETARRLREIGVLRRDSLGDLPGALEAFSSLFVIDPSAENRRELEELAAKLGRYDRLAEALAAAASKSDSRSRSLALFTDAAATYRDHLDDTAKAIELHATILSLAEGDNEALRDALRELNRLLLKAGRAAERCDVLERLAAVEADPAARREALGEAARLAWPLLGDAGRAIAAYKARLADDDADLEALDGMAAAYEQTERWSELVSALERRAAVKIDALRAADARLDLVWAAKILDERLGDIDAAIAGWTSVRDKLGPDAESGDALARLLERRERWDDLVGLLESEAKLAGSREREGALRTRLGDVHRDRTGKWDLAIGSYALGAAAGTEAALAGLEVLLSKIDRGSGEQRPLLIAAVDALTEAYEAIGAWQRTVALLEARLAAALDDARRVAILEETARLLETAALDLSAAFDAIWRAFLLIPSAVLAAEALRLARAAGRFQEVADALAASLEQRGDVPAPVLRDLWWNVGLWHRDARRDLDAAERAITSALAHDPRRAEMLAALADLQRRAPGRPLIDTLLRLADVTPGALDLHREAVETALDPVADRALARTTAERLFEVAMEVAGAGEPPPEVLWALDVLVRLALEEGDRSRVMELCKRGSEIPFPPKERKRLRIQAAEVADTEPAITLYKSLFDEEPTDSRVAGELEALYKKTGRTADLIAMRTRQVEVAEAAAPRVELRLDLGLLFAVEGDLDKAIAALRENLTEIATHAASVNKLGELLASRGLFGELVDLWESQAALAEAQTGAGDAGGRPEGAFSAAELWNRAASLAEQKLDDIPRAIADHRRAAALGAAVSLDALARLLTARGEPAAAAEVLEKLCAVAPPETAHTENLRLADALVAAGQPDVARTRLEQAIPNVKNAAPLRDRLAVLYREAEAWGPLADLIAEGAARIESRTARAARLREAAELHLNQRRDPGSAIPLLEQSAELLPDEMSVRLTLCQAYVEAGRLEDAAAVLRALLASYGGRRPKERAMVHYELARVLIAAKSREEALEELEAALRIDPAHSDILYALASLALEMDQLDRASRGFRALLLNVRRARDDQSTKLMRTEILFALSEISERQGEPDRAAEYFDSAFEASRESAEERERLVGALRARGRHGMLARALEARLASASDPAQAFSILDELAAVYDEHLGRAGDALDARLRGIGLDPTSTPAHEAARALAVRTGQMGKYIDLVTRLAGEATGEPRELDLLLHLGRAFGGDPSFDAKALPLYQRAEKLLEDRAGDPRRVEVFRALDAILGRAGDRAAQAAVLEKLIEEAPPEESSAEQADPIYRLAAIRFADPARQEQGSSLLERALGIDPQPDRVEAILRAAIDVAPKSEPALRLLERFARDTGRSRVLVEAILLLDAIGAASPDKLREAADVARSLDDKALLETCLRRLLAALDLEASPGPALPQALIELGDLRESEGDLTEAAALLERAAGVAPDDDARSLTLRVAALARGPLADLPRAARLYESLRKTEPASRAVWEPLAEIYRALGDEPSLTTLIQETVPLLDSQAEQSKLRIERARIVMRGDPEKAADLFREILAEDPTQLEASVLLADLLEKAGRDAELSELLRRQIEGAKDRDDKDAVVSLSMKLAALLEKQGDDAGARDLYHSVVDWDAQNLPAIRAIVRLGKKREDAVDLGSALDKLLAVEKGDETVDLALHLATLRTTQGDLPGAEQALEAGFRAAPSHADLREKLIASYTSREQWKKLADLHTADASRREDKAGRVEALCHAAEVLRERAHDVAGAADILERALETDPLDRDVLFALTDAYDTMGEHGRAAKAISIAIEASPGDAWLYRSRALHLEALGQHDQALTDLERAYAMSEGGYASELAELLERSLSRASEHAMSDWEAPSGMDDAQRALRVRLAEVLLKAGDAERARGHLGEILGADPKDRAALRMLAAIEEDQKRWDDAVTIYGRLVAMEEGEALTEAALKLASTSEQAGRLSDARPGLERALQSAPGNASLRSRLRAIYTAEGAGRELASLLLEDAAAEADPAARAQLFLQAGRLLLGAEGGVSQAVEVLGQARALRPDDQEILLLLADASAAAGDNAQARAVLAQVIATFKGRRAKQLAPVYQRLSRIEASEANLSESLAALSKAFEMDPSSGQVAMALGLQAIDLSEFEIASRAFRSVTMMKPAPAGSTEGVTSPQRAVAYYHLGDIARSQGDTRKARLMVEKAVSEDPTLEAARSLLDVLRAG
jgi:tetratricopeptide (TPR) repeat protein